MDKIDLKTTIKSLYNDILIDLNLNKINNYFAPTYVQTTDHVSTNFDEFKAHLKKLKEVVSILKISHFKTMIIDEDQNAVFLRYDVEVEKKNGNQGIIEVYAEFTFNDEGKVMTCNELTLPYHEALKGIGSIK